MTVHKNKKLEELIWKAKIAEHVSFGFLVAYTGRSLYLIKTNNF